jgi:hypothetical protein
MIYSFAISGQHTVRTYNTGISICRRNQVQGKIITQRYNRTLDNEADFKYLGKTVTNKNVIPEEI